MDITRIILGPLVGAVIGYFTNYLAVRMLFRPLQPKYLFGHRIPFTPGIIPKRKASLGTAIGDMVSRNLLTEEDLSEWLMSEELESTITDGIADAVFTEAVRKAPVSAVLSDAVGEQSYEEKRAFVSDYVTNKALESIQKVDFGGIIAEEGMNMVKRRGGMLAMFVNEELMTELGDMIGAQVERYLDGNGVKLLSPLVDSEITNVTDKTVPELLGRIGLSEERIRSLLHKTYRSWVSKNIPLILDKLDISGIICAKIDAMDSLALEKMVLRVMKKELDAVVRLGALIGALLGLLNAIPF